MLSLWGDGFPYVVTIMLVFTWDSRAKAFYYLLFLTLNVGLQNTTKMAYHEPRPFMYDVRLTPFKCTNEYGNPSGHSQFAAAFNIFVFLDYFHGDFP